MPVPSITPAAARARLASGRTDFLLLDVRQPEELALARVEGARAIPLGQLQARCAELPREAEIAVLCHHGTRSARAAEALLAWGWPRVVNVAGGIDAWSLTADASVPRY